MSLKMHSNAARVETVGSTSRVELEPLRLVGCWIPMPEGGDSLAGLGAASTAYQTMAKTIDIASIWRQARRAEILMSRLAEIGRAHV